MLQSFVYFNLDPKRTVNMAILDELQFTVVGQRRTATEGDLFIYVWVD
jgi:hypothetical protein